MKSGRSFDLPLSDTMIEIVEEALRVGEALFGPNPYLFPSRSNDGKKVIATATWREKSLPSETGHLLRRTHRTVAKMVSVSDSEACLLLDHKVTRMEKALSASPRRAWPRTSL